MKKEENHKRNAAIKNDNYSRSRPNSPKAYLGCDTCKLKNTKSNCKWGDYGMPEKIKLKKVPSPVKDEQRSKIKLTDLCDEDKKRLVQLIEELTILAEKNDQLKRKIEKLHKEKQEQQKYMLEQTNLFMQEKTIYINETDKYKTRLEAAEEELKNKISRYKIQEKAKDDNIVYLAKALQKSMKEKKELHGQMNSLKSSLKNSLEAFQKLKAEVTALQFKEEQMRKLKSVSCQTENKTNYSKRIYFEDDSEEEYLSTCNQEKLNGRSSLDLNNVQLENVYKLLKKSKRLPLSLQQKCETVMLKLNDDKSDKEHRLDDISQKIDSRGQTEENKTSEADDSLKTDDEIGGTSLESQEEDISWKEVEKIIKNGDTSSKLNINEYLQTLKSNDLRAVKSTRKARRLNLLKNKVIQKYNIFKSSKEDQYDEDKLLEELFYSDLSTNLGLNNRMKKCTKISNDPLILL